LMQKTNPPTEPSVGDWMWKLQMGRRLSPVSVFRLVQSDWISPDSAIRLNPNLTLNELEPKRSTPTATPAYVCTVAHHPKNQQESKESKPCTVHRAVRTRQSKSCQDTLGKAPLRFHAGPMNQDKPSQQRYVTTTKTPPSRASSHAQAHELVIWKTEKNRVWGEGDFSRAESGGLPGVCTSARVNSFGCINPHLEF